MMYNKDNPLRVVTLCSGYDSQCLALDRLKEVYPDFEYELIGWSEIDKYAIQAHNAIYPQWADRNLGDMTKIDWSNVPDFDLLTYSTPCLTADSLILTRDGYKPIIDVRVGDMVLTKSNTWHRVVKKFDNGQHPTCILRGLGFESIHCTYNHKFWVRKGERVWDNATRRYKRVFADPEFVEAKDIDKSYYFGIPIEKSGTLPVWDGVILNFGGHDSFRKNDIAPKLNTESFWYLMGRYVGDGWMRDDDNHKGIVICCAKEEREQLETRILDSGFTYSSAEERTVMKYTINSKELLEFVKRYGRYAYGKRIDGETMALPVHLIQAFLNGYMDSDGSFTENVFKATTVSRELAYGLSFLINKAYGCHCRVYKTARKSTCEIEGRKVSQRDSYEIVWYPEKRKFAHAFRDGDYIWYPFRDRTDSEYTNVYNIEVEEDHSYIVQGCISKNCQDFSNAGRQAGATEGSGTRSSILWYTRNAIIAKRPKYTMMENVKAVVSNKFIQLFRKWEQELASYGYANHCQVLNAKDYGVPQNRERIFLISIRDDESYFSFPEPFELKLRLKDVLEQKVDEKYYLSDEKVEKFVAHCDKKQAEGCGFKFEPTTGGGERKQ